ncbi:unnamed protein product [Rhizoctonia solani]|nr:unnamed protein product [Rhizoctonia solani]
MVNNKLTAPATDGQSLSAETADEPATSSGFNYEPFRYEIRPEEVHMAAQRYAAWLKSHGINDPFEADKLFAAKSGAPSTTDTRN